MDGRGTVRGAQLFPTATASACGGLLTYVSGSLATKMRVLEALRGEYDIIHIQAHGTFDESNPPDSALHFVSDLSDDSRRVTAFDLLQEVRFSRAPLIVLSACWGN
ncbi:CHAT domain-containing protein [Pseudomonas frederiksbergensis]|uniref:CHAT domain-containing protein n=1 Tax=Pseudomonas frederiksbergensis TaxID=104087 RepID=UPI003D255536